MPDFSLPRSPEQCRRMGNRDCSHHEHAHHTLSLLLLPPHRLILFQHGSQSSVNFSRVGLFPMGYSFSRTAPAWVFSMGCSPSGTNCSTVGPPQAHKSCQQTCSTVDLHRLQGGQPACHCLEQGNNKWSGRCCLLTPTLPPEEGKKEKTGETLTN